MAGAYSITADRVRSLLDYNPETGVFHWRGDRGGRKFSGKPAGSKCPNGYIEICIEGWRIKAHRLAWLYQHGEFPKHVIDHINGKRDDNRIANLRDVTSAANLQNQSVISENNATGIRGVSRVRDKYRVELQANGTRYHVGMFSSLEEAAKAYETKKLEVTSLKTLRA